MIPKIIHISWKSLDDLGNRFITLDDGSKIPLSECVQTFRDLNPHWEVRFHSDKDINDLICSEWPIFYPIFKGLKMIEKVDFFRYACLYKYGGLFLDTDCLCVRPLDDFLARFKEAKLIAGQEFLTLSNWINYPPHYQINLWSIFSEANNYHLRNVMALVIGNCIMNPKMPVIEKTSMAAFGDYLYKAAVLDPAISIVSTSYLSMDGRFRYMHKDSYGIKDQLPSYILHGYHSSWIDDDFRKYAKEMTQRDHDLAVSLCQN